MALKIFNTLSGKKEEFQPLTPGHVAMYVCGVTVYDHCHLGHARAYVSFDCIARYLRFCGYQLRYVRNVTDVDDKIIDKAQKEGVPVGDIAARYYDEFSQQMGLLHLLVPDQEPRATAHIEEMQALIGTLMEKGIAYQAGSDVCFAVGKFAGYGQLSKRHLDEMMAGARVEVQGNKDNPLDFVLWKAAKPGEPFWESPWGKGRPGWHIECSAMSMKYLGQTFDIHGGGQDLIFPHHENEMAQSQAATGQPLARYWVHNGFVMFRHQKMSKSTGNVFWLAQLFEQFRPAVVKVFLLSKHYRSPLDFDVADLQEAQKTLERIDNTLGLACKRLAEMDQPFGKPALRRDAWGGFAAIETFCQAMDDDFNTSRAMAIVHELMGQIHLALRSQESAENLTRVLSQLVLILDVLGIAYQPLHLDRVCQTAELSVQQEEALSAKEQLADSEVIALIEARNLARQKKDFARSDRIRKALANKGIVLRDDKSGGTTWVHEKQNEHQK